MEAVKMTLIAIFLILHLAIHDIIMICMVIQKEIWVEKCFKKCLPDVPYVNDIVLGQGRAFLFLLPTTIDILCGNIFFETNSLFRYLFFLATILSVLYVIVMMVKNTNKRKR